MGLLRGKEWTFDTVASTYEKVRPGYCDDLYQKIFDYSPLYQSSKIVEIGIGGGQATLPFLHFGCSLTAIEYGKSLSLICREKFKDFSKFNVIASKFEDLELAKNEYDLVYSASVFHWISEEIGYPKVFAILKEGGTFARFANHPYRCKNEPQLSDEIDKIYEKYYYKYYNIAPKKPTEYKEEDAKERAQIAIKYGFQDIQYEVYERIRTFQAKEYIELLSTYSDHIAIKEDIRKDFFHQIEDVILEHGGSINLYDTIDLQLARKLIK